MWPFRGRACGVTHSEGCGFLRVQRTKSTQSVARQLCLTLSNPNRHLRPLDRRRPSVAHRP
ncbi:hypothetical protein C791_4823 [Amycolatopsis azurea DSM 43854]|uniref:Uncharacterized protein n=1 Tax=Amycolatopsis azurea DSM 43854 TaxID=1238180 RepID=M2PLK3_9PSEU|nr:hypothetical protein C791_4823 [Amycolatopsis azurea DSM 43854]